VKGPDIFLAAWVVVAYAVFRWNAKCIRDKRVQIIRERGTRG
jgi:hypothetical protein